MLLVVFAAATISFCSTEDIKLDGLCPGSPQPYNQRYTCTYNQDQNIKKSWCRSVEDSETEQTYVDEANVCRSSTAEFQCCGRNNGQGTAEVCTSETETECPNSQFLVAGTQKFCKRAACCDIDHWEATDGECYTTASEDNNQLACSDFTVAGTCTSCEDSPDNSYTYQYCALNSNNGFVWNCFHEPLENQKLCCFAEIASCLACKEGKTVAEYCLDNPMTQGCDCEDLPGWTDSGTTCADIEQLRIDNEIDAQRRCNLDVPDDSYFISSNGITASEACCACGGGRAREADPPDASGSSGLPAGAIAGIAVGTVAVVGLAGVVAL